MSHITLYRRASCHLCDEARTIITQLQVPGDTFEEVDIDADPALIDEYTIRVPVVTVDGQEVAQYVVEPAALRLALGR